MEYLNHCRNVHVLHVQYLGSVRMSDLFSMII